MTLVKKSSEIISCACGMPLPSINHSALILHAMQLDDLIVLIMAAGQCTVDTKPGLVHTDNCLRMRHDQTISHAMQVDDLNALIRAAGQRKVDSLVGIKDFKGSIYKAQWENARLDLQASSLLPPPPPPPPLILTICQEIPTV